MSYEAHSTASLRLAVQPQTNTRRDDAPKQLLQTLRSCRWGNTTLKKEDWFGGFGGNRRSGGLEG
eukprot:168621-Rhodomonas_salina.3